MNPAWIPAIAALGGMTVNAFWFTYNLGQKAAIERQELAIGAMKQWALEKFVQLRPIQ